MSAVKFFELAPASSSALYEWWRVEVTDPAFCAVPLGDGDIHAETMDGRRLNVYVLERTAVRIRVTVVAPGPVWDSDRIRIRLYATADGAPAQEWRGWGARIDHPPRVGPALLFRTHTPAQDPGGTKTQTFGPSDQWIHPNVYRVDQTPPSHPGYWLRFSTAARRAADAPDVTHIRIDTPFPTDVFENPYLLYATDGLGMEWYEWNGEMNPIQPWPGGSGYNSDPCLALREDGTIYTPIRQTGNNTRTIFRIISGTCLAEADVGGVQYAPVDRAMTSPSVVKHGGRWLIFHRSGEGVFRQESADEGESWTNPVLVFRNSHGAQQDGAPVSRGVWHGSVSGDIRGGPFSNGYFYAYYTENWVAGANSGAATPRVWRTRDPYNGPWEVSFPTVYPWDSTGDVADYGYYQGCVFERSDGGFGAFTSGANGSNVAGSCGVGCGPINLSDDQLLTEREAFQALTSGLGAASADYKNPAVTRGVVTEVSAIEYQAEYRVGDGPWTAVAPWGPRFSELDTAGLTGPIQIRGRARNAATLEEAVGDPITVAMAQEAAGSARLSLTLGTGAAGAKAGAGAAQTSAGVHTSAAGRVVRSGAGEARMSLRVGTEAVGAKQGAGATVMAIRIRSVVTGEPVRSGAGSARSSVRIRGAAQGSKHAAGRAGITLILRSQAAGRVTPDTEAPPLRTVCISAPIQSRINVGSMIAVPNIRVGDVGTRFDFAFCDETGAPLDLSDATDLRARFMRPDGTTVDVPLVRSETPGVASYTTPEGFFSMAGHAWRVQGIISTAAGTWHCGPMTFAVLRNLPMPAGAP